MTAQTFPATPIRKIVPICVSTRERLTALPDVAPMADAVPGFDFASWSFRRLSVTPLGGSPADMEQHVRTELNKWKRIVAENGIQAQ